MGGLVEGLLCFLGELSDGAADHQELRLDVTYQLPKDFVLPRHWRPKQCTTFWRS
jgi:hypothetical protein